MKITHLFFLLFFCISGALSAQTIHPLSNPDLLFGKVAQVKEIYYLEPKTGEKIDTLEKRITWYDTNGNTDAIEKFIHTKTGWVPSPNPFAIRLKKFGNPPITTGKDSLEFTIKYDSLGNEAERDNYASNGKLSSKWRFYYNPEHLMIKSEVYFNDKLFHTTNYSYVQNKLVKARVIFPNNLNFDILYKYEGTDANNNWLKRTVTYNAGSKLARVEVIERRVILYP